jgi:hypothetical protein
MYQISTIALAKKTTLLQAEASACVSEFANMLF